MEKRHGSSAAAIVALSGVAALALSSCASSAALARAQGELRRGDKPAAVLAAAESLSHSPSNEEAMDILETNFPLAVAELRSRAETAAAETDPLRWETVVDSWEKIHAMNDAVNGLPPLSRKGSSSPLAFRISYNLEFLEAARAEAAAARYSEGLDYFALGKRADYRKSYASFAKALEFSPGYEDAEKLAAEARELGSDRVAVIPFSTAAWGYDAESMTAALYSACVEALVAEARDRAFFRIVEPSRVESLLGSRLLGASDPASLIEALSSPEIRSANIALLGQLLAVSAEYPAISVRTEEFRIEEAQPPGGQMTPGAGIQGGEDGKPAPKAVKRATVTIYTKRSRLTASVSFRAVDLETSIVLDARTLSDGMEESCEWAISFGDPEAVPQKYAAVLGTRERDIASPTEMMAKLAARMSGRFAQDLAGKL